MSTVLWQGGAQLSAQGPRLVICCCCMSAYGLLAGRLTLPELVPPNARVVSAVSWVMAGGSGPLGVCCRRCRGCTALPVAQRDTHVAASSPSVTAH